MGVPAFFRKLTKKHKIITFTNNRKIDYLYIDANCLFHPQCFLELEQNIDETNINILNSKMFIRIIAYIDKLIDIVKPNKFTFIAVDGVAPLAKINQQRVRRFANTNNYKHRIMLKHNIKFNDKWSNIVITPATQFMYDLNEKLLAHFKNNKKIIYSSYLENGEGEHKILQHMKSIDYKEQDNCVIYGLDADLIFLALASNKSNIFLLRETNQVTNDTQDNFCYVNIDHMKSCIRKENINTDDYIFICYFLGNDFLPHLPSIDININGYELLLGVYLEIYDKLLVNLIIRNKNKISINHQFLLEFIERLSSYENIFFKKDLPEYLAYKRQQKCYETELYKKEIWEYENLRNVKIIDNIKLNNPGFKERYYEHYFHIETKTDELKSKICHNYLEGLVWVANYYFLECNSWRWQYKYTHPPFLSDIYNYLKMKDINKDFNIMNSKAINMNTQLLCVIPPQFSHVLPQKIRHLNSSIDSPIIDMFPMMYKLDMINKTQLYKCIPILPYLDIDRVEKAIDIKE
jgi:5'-3' exonuclease